MVRRQREACTFSLMHFPFAMRQPACMLRGQQLNSYHADVTLAGAKTRLLGQLQAKAPTTQHITQPQASAVTQLSIMQASVASLLTELCLNYVLNIVKNAIKK